MRKSNSALVFYLLAIVIWGADAAVTKAFLLTTLSPLLTLVGRFAIAALCLLPFIYGELRTLPRLTPKDWLSIGMLGLLGTALPNWLYLEALVSLPASIVLLLYRLEPIFAILIALILFHQPITLYIWPFLLIAIACSYIIVTGGAISPLTLGPETTRGIMLTLAGTVLWAVATFVGKALLTKVSPILLVWLRFSLALGGLLLCHGSNFSLLLTLTPGDLFWLSYLGIVSTGLAYIFYYKGLAASSPILASIIQLLGPVVGLPISFLLLNEQLSYLQLGGAVGLLASLYVLTLLTVTDR
jgi:drug/metabolite transporter (DMT)-like permease